MMIGSDRRLILLIFWGYLGFVLQHRAQYVEGSLRALQLSPARGTGYTPALGLS
jgi:hypothetical protein